jgi:hypothetical protein
MEQIAPRIPITISKVEEKYDMARSTIDRKCDAGIYTKFTLPGSSKVFLDEQQIMDSFIVKKKSNKR